MRFKTGDRVAYVRTYGPFHHAVGFGCKATVREPAYVLEDGVNWLNVRWSESDPRRNGQCHGAYHEESFDPLKEEDMTKKLDLTKPVQTKSGKPVRILCTDRVGDMPVIGLVKNEDGKEVMSCWTKEGSITFSGRPEVYDLVNVPEEVTLWFNVYLSSDGEIYTGGSFPTEAKALAGAALGRVDTVSRTFTV